MGDYPEDKQEFAYSTTQKKESLLMAEKLGQLQTFSEEDARLLKEIGIIK